MSSSRDLLAFTIATFPHANDLDPATRTGRKFPNVNHLGRNGHRAGRKSPEYRALFKAIKQQAEIEVAISGWETADYYCEIVWRRIVTDLRLRDSLNDGKCELDALESAGVFTNDALVVPRPDLIQCDLRPGAIDRISFAIFRLYPPILLAERPVRSAKRAEPNNIRKPKLQAIRKKEPAPLSGFRQGDVVSFEQRDQLLREIRNAKR